MKQIYIDSVFKLHNIEPEKQINSIEEAINILGSTGNFKYLLFDDEEDTESTVNSIEQKINELPDTAIVDIELLKSYRGLWEDAKIHYKNGKFSFAAISTDCTEDSPITFYESRRILSEILNTGNKKHSLGMYTSLNELAIKIVMEKYYEKVFNNPSSKEIIFGIYAINNNVVVLYGKDIKSQLFQKILDTIIKEKKVAVVTKLITFCSNDNDNSIFGTWHKYDSNEEIIINNNEDITALADKEDNVVLER